MSECHPDELKGWRTTSLYTSPMFCEKSVKTGPIYIKKLGNKQIAKDQRA